MISDKAIESASNIFWLMFLEEFAIIGGVEGVCSVKYNNANTNNPQPHHSQTQHNFKAIKAQFTFAVIFFFGAAPVYMGIDRTGRLFEGCGGA